MWVIGMIVCLGLMVVGHGVMNGNHGAHSHERPAAQEPAASAAAPGDALAEAAPENEQQPDPVRHH